MDIKTIADYLVTILKNNGFSIHRYDAYSTNSVYLKLDWGVCNSIRISDHKGKKYLKYRYNVILDTKQKEVFDEFKRLYYNQHGIANMVTRIINDKQQKIRQYGAQNYDRFVQENKRNSCDEKGFWTQAKLM